ncbi:MAG: GNAT family N-acetyltransferase [Saprospiraceae bacterium]|nr:GNAT family N-acetyltransferase [Saprospiraceae bacterium]
MMTRMEQPIKLIPLQPQHIPLGMQLKSWANWNQVEADWRLLLQLSKGGTFVATIQGKPVGTAVTIHYHTFFWIGMVLVNPTYRGKGVGTYLLKAALAYAKPEGAVMLDATALGQPLYQSLGFQAIGEVARLERNTPTLFSIPPHYNIQAMRQKDLGLVIGYDQDKIQFRRALLLQDFYERAPAFAFKALQGETLMGFCLGRSGSHFHHIGPIVADNREVAQALLAQALLAAPRRPLIIDVPIREKDWLAYLVERGFTMQRSFTRMCIGDQQHVHESLQQYAIAGPALA